MHAIRTAARKQAWYNNNDGSARTYNFFGRPNRNPRRNRDEETGAGLNHVSTESETMSPIEQERQAQWSTPSNSNGVRKSGTFPSGPSGDIPRYQSGGALADDKTEDTPSPIEESPTTQTTGLADDSKSARKRFHIPHFGHKDNKQDDSNLDRKATTESSKGKKSSNLSLVQQLKVTFASWINILLVFVPVGLAFQYAKLNGTATFIFNFLAIIPLASMLSFATEEVAFYVGDSLGGLLNATFGNATELIVSVIALTQHKITIVQTSLIGSILSNLLLVLGMCFFFGGINRLEQFFNVTVAQTAASLLALSVGGLVTPTAFRIFDDSDDDPGVLPTSRATAVLLLFTYLAYLVFQLRTHLEMYNEPSQKAEKQNLLKKKSSTNSGIGKTMNASGAPAAAAASEGSFNEKSLVNEQKAAGSTSSDDDEENEDQPQLSLVVALCVLAGATALIAVTSDGMVSAIDAVSGEGKPLSEEFVGLILVPIVGNAAEHATAVTCAIKDKVDLAIGVAVGSSLQIALLVIPLLVCLNWFGVGAPSVLSLNFDGFQIVVLFIAVILVNYVIADGRSHWLEGLQLFIVYFIFAVAAWYYPAKEVPA